MGLVLVVLGALVTVLAYAARLVNTLGVVAHDDAQGWSRLAQQVVNLDVPIEGVTITLDPSTPPEAPCRLFKLETTTPAGHHFVQYASRGCVNQDTGGGHGPAGSNPN